MIEIEGTIGEDDLLPGEAEVAEAIEHVQVATDTRPTFGKVPDASAYESRNPNFTAGGTAYVRAYCPECSEPMFFAVETDVQLTIKGDERKLKPTFKATPKPHACHQVVAALTDEEGPVVDVEPAPGPCPCSECVGGCDGESEDGIERCVPCRTGQHVDVEEPEEPSAG